MKLTPKNIHYDDHHHNNKWNARHAFKNNCSKKWCFSLVERGSLCIRNDSALCKAAVHAIGELRTDVTTTTTYQERGIEPIIILRSTLQGRHSRKSRKACGFDNFRNKPYTLSLWCLFDIQCQNTYTWCLFKSRSNFGNLYIFFWLMRFLSLEEWCGPCMTELDLFSFLVCVSKWGSHFKVGKPTNCIKAIYFFLCCFKST